jgi:hypothetical protein
MVRVRRILVDLFHRVMSGCREEPAFTGRPLAWFEGGVVPERFCLGMRGAAQEAALARGMKLLSENLSRAQRDQYEREGYFDVIGGETGRRYRIRKGFQANVEQLDGKNGPVGLLCFMPKDDLVLGDVMLAQKLALELFERDALKAANKFSPSPHFL